MPARIKKKFKLEDYKRALTKVPKFVDKSTEREIVDIIVQFILQGKSPVKGKRNFKDYSASYTRAINSNSPRYSGKGPNPVNLNLTGDMLGSIKAKILRGSIFSRKIPFLRITVSDPKAKWHNEGVKLKKGKIPARRFIPIDNEEFKPKVMREILRAIGRAAFLSLKKIK